MRDKLKYDLVVVGAGPAGCSAAKAAAKGGIQVLLVERKDQIGLPVQCAEHIPKLLTLEVNFDSRSIAQEVDRLRTYLPSGETIEVAAPGYILDRSLFDRELALEAIRAGADILIKTVAVSYEEDKVIAIHKGRRLEIETKVIVGADGPTSTVGKWIDKVNGEFVSALQCYLTLSEKVGVAEVYFDFEYKGGYAWFFPKGALANIGVGVNRKFGQDPQTALEHFLQRLEKEGKIRAKSVLGYTGGLVPVNGYLDKMRVGKFILVGDAAGQTDPITGAGILSAIVCGQIGGEVAVEAIKGNNLEILAKYEKRVMDRFQKTWERAKMKRRYLDSCWNERDLEEALRRCWIAFPEYYKE